MVESSMSKEIEILGKKYDLEDYEFADYYAALIYVMIGKINK